MAELVQEMKPEDTDLMIGVISPSLNGWNAEARWLLAHSPTIRRRWSSMIGMLTVRDMDRSGYDSSPDNSISNSISSVWPSTELLSPSFASSTLVNVLSLNISRRFRSIFFRRFFFTASLFLELFGDVPDLDISLALESGDSSWIMSTFTQGIAVELVGEEIVLSSDDVALTDTFDDLVFVATSSPVISVCVAMSDFLSSSEPDPVLRVILGGEGVSRLSSSFFFSSSDPWSKLVWTEWYRLVCESFFGKVALLILLCESSLGSDGGGVPVWVPTPVTEAVTGLTGVVLRERGDPSLSPLGPRSWESTSFTCRVSGAAAAMATTSWSSFSRCSSASCSRLRTSRPICMRSISERIGEVARCAGIFKKQHWMLKRQDPLSSHQKTIQHFHYIANL